MKQLARNSIIAASCLTSFLPNGNELVAEESPATLELVRSFRSRIEATNGRAQCYEAIIPNMERNPSSPYRGSITYIGANNTGSEYIRFSDGRLGSPTPRITPPFPARDDYTLGLQSVVFLPDSENPIVPSSISSVYNSRYNGTASFINSSLVHFSNGEYIDFDNSEFFRMPLPEGIIRIDIHGLSHPDSSTPFALATYYGRDNSELHEISIDFDQRKVEASPVAVSIDPEYYIESCGVYEFNLMSGTGSRQVVICNYGNSTTGLGDVEPIVLHRSAFIDGSTTDFEQDTLYNFYNNYFDDNAGFNDSNGLPYLLTPRSRHSANSRQTLYDVQNTRYLYHLDCTENDLGCPENHTFNTITGDCDLTEPEHPEVVENPVSDNFNAGIIESATDDLYMPRFDYNSGLDIIGERAATSEDVGIATDTASNVDTNANLLDTTVELGSSSHDKNYTNKPGCSITTKNNQENNELPLGATLLALATLAASTKRRILAAISDKN
jgi:hypothetical protein